MKKESNNPKKPRTGYTSEEYKQSFDEIFGNSITLAKPKDQALSHTDKVKTYEVTFHKIKKI